MPSLRILASLGLGASVPLTQLAQAAKDAGADLGPYISGGGAALAVGTLAYVLKQYVKGEILTKPVAEYHREIGALTIAGGQREERLMQVIEQQQRQIADLTKREADTNRLLWRIGDHLGIIEDPRKKARG